MQKSQPGKENKTQKSQPGKENTTQNKLKICYRTRKNSFSRSKWN